MTHLDRRGGLPHELGGTDTEPDNNVLSRHNSTNDGMRPTGTGPDASYQARLSGVVRPELDISVRHEPEEAVVALSGEIDIGTVSRLVAAVETALAGGPSRLVLDMGQVTFCDSQGLGTLVVLNRTATRARSSLVLINVSDFLARLLEVTGLRQAFTIRDDIRSN